MSVPWRGLDRWAEFRGEEAESVEQSGGGRSGNGREQGGNLPSSLVRSSVGLLGGPSPICVNASTCSTYTAYFWRPPSNTDVLASPSATWVTGGASASFSLYITCVETQTCHSRAWITVRIPFEYPHKCFSLVQVEVWDTEAVVFRVVNAALLWR